MYKLQKALQMRGVIVTISEHEFYSNDQERFIKKYIVRRGKDKIVESCSQLDVIHGLKKIYDEEREKDGRRNEDNQEAAKAD